MSMIKFFQKRFIRIRTAFTFFPKHATAAYEQPVQSFIPVTTNIFDTLNKFKTNQINKDSFDYFKEIYHDDFKILAEKIDISGNMPPEVIQNVSDSLNKIILTYSKQFDLQDIEVSLAILYSLSTSMDVKDSNIVKLLENRFVLLADNRTLSDYLFAKTFSCLEYFSLNKIKLSSQDYLDDWYKRALENLKFYSSSQIANLIYIASVQTPQKSELYHEIKLQLFKNTSVYLREFVKLKLGLDTNDIKNPAKFVKQAVAKLFLSNYERKGIYWTKDFDFSLSDSLILIRAFNNLNDHDSDFLIYLANSTLQNLLESLKSNENRIEDLQLVFLLKEYSEAIKRIKGNEQVYQQLLESLISIMIRVIPRASTNTMEKISEALSGLEETENHESQIHLIKNQLALKLNPEFILQNFANILFHSSFLNILKFIIMSQPKHLNQNILQKGSKIFSDYLHNFDKSSSRLTIKNPAIFNKCFDIGFSNILTQKDFNSFLKIVTELPLEENSISTEFGIDFMYACVLAGNQITPNQIKNMETCLDFIINNASISEFNQKLLWYFFSTYKILSKRNVSFADQSTKYLHLLRDTLLRYFADHYQKFDLNKFEAIIYDVVAVDIHTINFDDGSNLYNKTLLEEIEEYTQKNYKLFTEDFQALVRKLYPPKEN